MEQIDRALGNGVRVSAWTFDELYGRTLSFLDGLQSRGQLFVGEIPSNFFGWTQKPVVVQNGPKKKAKSKRGRPKPHPRVSARRPACKVSNLVKYSPIFRNQSWRRYRIKDSDKGPEVWEIKCAEFWRKDESGLPTRRHYLIVARNVLSGEMKYFLANRVPGELNPVTGKYITLRDLLRVALGRWSIESCFRQSKEELGLDHYEVRGWRAVHRHFYVTQLSHLFCARVRQEYDQSAGDDAARLTVEQVRSAMNVWLRTADLCPCCRRKQLNDELRIQQYYQKRNAQARASHTKTRIAQLQAIGIDVDKIRSCISRKDSATEPVPIR